MNVGEVKAEVKAGIDGFKTKLEDAKETLNTAIDSMKAKSNEMNIAFENMDKKLELWSKQNKVAADSSKYHSKELENNKSKMEQLSNQIKQTEKVLSETEKQFGKNSTEYKKQETQLVNLRIKYEDLINENKKLAGSTGVWNTISRGMDRAGNKLKDLGGKVSNFGTKFSAKISAPVAGIGAIATKSAMDFEKGMAKANTIAKLGKQDLDNLSKSTLDLSNNTGIVSKDLAEMEYNALSASVGVKDLTGVVKQSAELSKGGFADANNSLKLLTSTYNVFKDDFEKGSIDQIKASQMIADKMITIQNLGVTTVGELSTQIGNVTSISKNANMTLDDLGASMIVLTKNGLGTSQSVTGLKAALSNIIKPSEQASKISSALGLEFSTTAIKTKGFGGFLKDLREKLKQANPALVEAADKVSKYQHMIDGASKSQKANKEQMRVWKGQLKDAKEQLKVLTKSGGETTGALAQLFGSVEGLGSVLTLTSEYGMKDFQKGLEASKNSLGSTKKAADMMAETTSEKFAKAMNKLKNKGIELGLKLMPLAEKGVKYIEEFTGWLSKLSPKTQEFAIKVGIAAVAFGPFIGGLGKAISGIGSMVKMGGSVARFFGFFNKAKLATSAVEGIGTAATVATGTATGGGILGLASSLGAAVLPFAPWIAGATAVGVAGYGVYKALTKEAIPAVDLFADKVSETSDGMYQDTIKISKGTKKAVGSYIKLDEEATKSLNHMYTETTMLTEENGQKIISTYDKMGQQVLQGQKKRNNEQYKELESFFKLSSALTYEEEQNALAAMRYEHQTQEEETKQSNRRIQEILKNASKEKRALTSDEMKVIKELQDKQKQNAVKALSETEVESKVILERIKGNDKRLTAEQASAHIQELNKCKDKAVKAAEEEYNKRVAAIIRQRDETKTISADQADKLIKEAERQKNDAIKKAEEQKQQVVQKMKEQNSELEKEIDTSDGSIRTKWDNLKSWFTNNPIVRWIKSKVEEPATQRNVGQNVPKHAKGTDYFEGGLTWIDEEGSELIQLPGKGPKLANLPIGTKIFNHDKSNEIKQKAKQRNKVDGYERGTNSAEKGIHEVAENGFEIVTCRQQRYFNGGEKVFNNDDSKRILSLLSSNADSENIAKRILEEVGKSNNSNIKMKSNTNETEISKNTSRMLNWGSNNKKAYQDFLKFKDKLNKSELEQSKEYLHQDYENRVKALEDRLRILKNQNKIELQTEKNRVDAQIAYYQKLQRNTKNKNVKKDYDNKIASLRQYEKTVLNTTKANQKAQIDNLETSKRALQEYYREGTKLLESREKEVKNSEKNKQNIFKNSLVTYDAAIKKLKKSTNNLSEELQNQKAIVIIQERKINTLKNRYEELSKTFGATSNEAIKLRQELENAKIELEGMDNTIAETNQKIIESEKEKNKEIADSINNLVNRVKRALKEKYDDELKNQETLINNEVNNLDKWKSESISKINEVYETKKKVINESANIQINALQKEIKVIEENEKRKEYYEKELQETNKIKRLEEALAFEHNEFNKSELKKEINKLTKEREKRIYKEQIEEKKESLNNRIKLIKDNANREKEALDNTKKYEIANIEKIYKAQKDSLDQRIISIKKFYEIKLNEANINAEAEKLIFDNNQKEIIRLLYSYEHDYEQVGQSLGEKLVMGFRPRVNQLKEMISEVQKGFEVVRNLSIENITLGNDMINSIPNSYNKKINNLTTNNKTINNITFNSPKTLTPSEQLRKTETTLRELNFSI